MQIQLEPDAQRLLRDVQAGKVARHRRSLSESPKFGDDFQEDRFGPPYRRATARVAQLRKKGLVELPDADPVAASWPWRTTRLGDTVITLLDKKVAQSKGDSHE